jgi:hypothetical protein
MKYSSKLFISKLAKISNTTVYIKIFRSSLNDWVLTDSYASEETENNKFSIKKSEEMTNDSD